MSISIILRDTTSDMGGWDVGNTIGVGKAGSVVVSSCNPTEYGGIINGKSLG